MPAKKIVSDIYTIRAPEVVIDGNLIVGGSQTALTVQNTSIQDRTITLNQGENGPGITGGNGTSGIEVDRGNGADIAYLKFRESDDAWILDNGDGVVKYILTSAGSSAGTGLTAVVEDTSPTLGGNLEVNGNTITDTVSNVEIIFDTVSGGGSGVFVTNDNFDQANKQELVIKRKAFIYALIF
jgi:hypothetical protein